VIPTLAELRQALHITGSTKIARRYFVTNGFDGSLAMLGLLIGFRSAGGAGIDVVIAACLGTAIALGASGISSTYVSERAERRRELERLRGAMLKELEDSAHARAAQWAPVLVALVSGLAPFLLALIIMLPLWLQSAAKASAPVLFDTAIGIAFLLIFLLGVFLGLVAGSYWLWSGLRTLAIALVTAGIILLVAPR
jgi:predicted membrane protein (TIGR00267 family)